MKITRMLLFGFVLVVTLLAAACSSGSAGPTATPVPGATTPVDAVKGFLVAVYTGQDPSPFVCGANSDAAGVFEVAARASSSAMIGASVDTSGLTFIVKNQTATSATVTVAGQIVYTMLSGKSPVPFPTSNVSAVVEGGSWKFCGGAS